MIDAITRREQYLAKAVDGSLTVPKPVTRQELFLAKLAGEDVTTPKPITREEMYLDKIVLSSGGGGTGGGDFVLPTLTNEGAAADLRKGKELLDGNGRIVVGEAEPVEQATPSININSSGLITVSATQDAGFIAAGVKNATKQLATQAAKTVTPTTSEQIAVASGVYTTGEVKVAAIPSSYVQPTGTKDITENGTHDVKNYETVNVAVTSGGGGDTGDDDVASILANNIVHLSNSKATKIAVNGIFRENSFLESVYLPEVTNISAESAFYQCMNLQSVYLPKLTRINNYGFFYCTKLVDLSLPSLTYLGANALKSCTALTNVYLPETTTIGNYGIENCKSLEILDVPKLSQMFNALNDCAKLKAVVIRKTDSICNCMVSLSCSNTPIKNGTGFFYFPAALIDQYKSASNWSVWASQFRVLEEYTVDGTVTGALDLSKI